MATLSEIQNKLALFTENAVYPNGITNPSVINKNVPIAVGWPLKQDLDAIVESGYAMISIFSDMKVETNTTRFFRSKSMELSIETTSLSLNIVGNQVVVNGTPVAGEIATITLRTALDKNYYYYVVQTGDSIDLIANNLGTLIPGATILANVITIPSAVMLFTNVVTKGILGQEIRRQKKTFLITCFTATVEDRTVLGDAVDLYLANIYRFDVSDGSALMIYEHTFEDDEIQKHKIYRRQLCYRVEYPTVLKTEASTVADATTDLIINE